MEEVLEGARQRPVWVLRVGAFLVDLFALGVGGFLVIVIAQPALERLGAQAVLVGLGLATLYFGVLSSSAGGGRTLGHRLFGLEVVDRQGRRLGLARSLGRAFVLSLGYALSSTDRLDVVSVLAVLASSLTWCQVYLVVFNRADGRLVHDLLAGTLVQRAGAETPSPARLAGVHRAALGVVAALACGLAGWGLWNTSHRAVDTFVAELLAQPGLSGAGWKVLRTTDPISGQELQVLQVDARLDGATTTNAARLARLALKDLEGAQSVDRITIVLDTSVSLGIASWAHVERVSKSPAEWAQPD